jgi:hypothetical protein
MTTAQRWQFKLWHIFALMTYAAIATALVRLRGPGTLVASSGVLIAALSWLGAFEPLQSGRAQQVVLGLAWLAFVLSLALPSIQVFGPVLGAHAAWASLLAPLNVFQAPDPHGEALVFYLPTNMANLTMSALPLVMWRVAHGKGQVLCAVLAVTMVWPWCLGWNSRMLIGYYVWCASFMAVLLAIRMPAWVVFAMGLIVAFFAIVAQRL